MLKKFYCRLSSATLLTLMLLLYFHLEEIAAHSKIQQRTLMVEDTMSFRW